MSSINRRHRVGFVAHLLRLSFQSVPHNDYALDPRDGRLCVNPVHQQRRGGSGGREVEVPKWNGLQLSYGLPTGIYAKFFLGLLFVEIPVLLVFLLGDE